MIERRGIPTRYRDPTFPESFASLESLKGYLLRTGACREAPAVGPPRVRA
jgi:hypothetical protein